jgi:hypothetical protein
MGGSWPPEGQEELIMFSLESVIGRQNLEVQSKCDVLRNEYFGQKSVEVRIAWGGLLDSIRRSKLSTVNEKGEIISASPTESAEARTFGSILDELGIKRSSAYNYISEYEIVTNYPKTVQLAACAANLNLALPHVIDAFIAGDFPENPDALQATGIVAKLKQVKPLGKPTKARMSPIEHLMKLLNNALEFAEKNKLGMSQIDLVVVEMQGTDEAKLSKFMELFGRQLNISRVND